MKGQGTRTHTVHLTKKTETPEAIDGKPLIGLLTVLPYDKSDQEIKSAWDFLKGISGFAVEYITFRELEKRPKTTGRFSAIWIHRVDTTALTGPEIEKNLVQSLKSYAENGGRLLLTLRAVHYLNILGFELQPLTDSTKSCVDNGYGRKLGFHAFRNHPLFDGLNGGAYISRPIADITSRISGFFGEDIPKNGKVAAVDWDYIFLRENSKIVLEYTPGKGRVIAAGGYMNFSLANLNRAHLELFTVNCFNYLLGKNMDQSGFYWDYSKNTVIPCQLKPQTDQLITAVPTSEKWVMPPDSLSLTNRYATGNFWDVAGERLVTMGTEKGGIEEVWAHPFMAFRDYEVGIRFEYRDTIFWLNDERPEIEVNPACFAREYKFKRAYLKEVVVNDPEKPEGVIHYEYRGVYAADLIIRFRSNLRWMWPYSEKVTGSICYAWDSDLDAIRVQDQSGDLNVKIGGNRNPVYHTEGQFDGFNYQKKDSLFHGIPTMKFQVAGLLQYHLSMNDNLDIVYTATNEGGATADLSYNQAVRNPKQIYLDAVRHARETLSQRMMITTPDASFNTGYRWALLATDRFFVNTPGMGKALVAGYSTTRHGWDGGHKINGRPGYGWYFGRDGEWSSFALLDCGDFDKVRAELEFFNKYQDLSGKILHEASTSGLIHYDAADATPLYIVLAGKYFRHTNDTAFLRKTWPNVKRAIAFCFSTDTDHDHLIENTNVGHGWVEGGELYGSHATLYMNGSWAAALAEAANMAGFMHDADGAKYSWEAEEVRKVINTGFWSSKQQFYAYGKNRDGSFRLEPTVLASVPIYFKATDAGKAAMCLRQYAGNAFTTEWGARIIRDDSPLFKPAGYHYGSVWPLFTGWTSLAEYAGGNPVQGFSHLMNNLNIYKNWGLGFAEEVLNGAEYKPSGVCAHQCWSETMIIQPALEGLLGLDVRAQENKLNLSPSLPAQWDSIDVKNIRIDNRRVDLHYTRKDNPEAGQKNSLSTWHFSLDQGKSVKIVFMPAFPPATQIHTLTLNGRPIQFTTFKSGQNMTMYAEFELQSSSQLIVETTSGISVLPAISDPKPGDPAEGLRIIATRYAGNRYQVEVEGKSGSTGLIYFWSASQNLIQASNATFIGRSGRIFSFNVKFDTAVSKYISKIITVDVNE